jgi:hypothetical protein
VAVIAAVLRRFLNARSTLRLPTLSRPHLSALVVKVCSALNIVLRAWRCTVGLASRVVECRLGLRLSLGFRLIVCATGKRQCQCARGDDPHGEALFSPHNSAAAQAAVNGLSRQPVFDALKLQRSAPLPQLGIVQPLRLGRCPISVRTSASVRSVMTSGMTSGRGRARDQFGWNKCCCS